MRNSMLLQIRWWQIRKEARGIGLLYIAVLLLLAFVVAAALYQCYRKNMQQALIASGIIILAVLALQVSRKDKIFIRRHMVGGVRNIALEYIVLMLPFTCTVLLSPHWWLFFLVQTAFVSIARITTAPGQQVWFGFLSTWIPPRDFEWLSGFRKNFLPLVLFYAAALGLCWLRIAPLVALWIITTIVTSFYIEGEPLHILKAESNSPAVMLRAKMRRHLSLLFVISLPVLLINTLLCPAMWWLNLAFLLTQGILLVFAILLKYTTYRPDSLSSGNNLLLGMMSVSVLIPFLLLLPLLMSIRNYRRAVVNLKDYYHRDQCEGY